MACIHWSMWWHYRMFKINEPMKQVAHTTCFIGLIWLLTNFVKKGQRTNVGVGRSPWTSSCPWPSIYTKSGKIGIGICMPTCEKCEIWTLKFWFNENMDFFIIFGTNLKGFQGFHHHCASVCVLIKGYKTNLCNSYINIKI